MSRSPGNSLLHSLRGIIWISTSVLAFFICTFGLISYLVVTLLTTNAFYGVFVPFVILAFIVIVFGWWLSNELLKPIEKVTLLSKSLERNSSTSLPKTSGSFETDQLLQTLHRNSQQMQNIVSLMDKVSNGNLDVALTPLKGSDRLTASFQKLLSTFSESIQAKEKLTNLEGSIEEVNRKISGVKNGNLVTDIESDHYETKEITETFKYLIEKLTLMVSLVKVDSVQANNSAEQIGKVLESIVVKDENSIQQMNHASTTLQQVPGLIEKISEELMNSAKSAKQTIDKTQHGAKISQENSESVGQLRIKVREAVNRIQNLNERSLEIGKVAKTVEDLANRTNMIALNASIQATEFGEEGRSFVLVSEELERLAARANGTNKQISMLNSTILSEISKVEESLETTMGEVVGLSKYAIETTNVLSELERYVVHFLNLQENLIAFSKDQSDETDEAFEAFVTNISNSENSVKDLKQSSELIRNISKIMKNLQTHTTEFRVIAPYELQKVKSEIGTRSKSTPLDSHDKTHEDKLYEEFASKEFGTDEFNAARLNNAELNAMNNVPKESDSKGSKFDYQINRELNSDSFNSGEFDFRDMQSSDFDSEELGILDSMSEPYSISNADSKDFTEDDHEIHEQKVNADDSQESATGNNVELPLDDNDLLDLTDQPRQKLNPNVSA